MNLILKNKEKVNSEIYYEKIKVQSTNVQKLELSGGTWSYLNW